MSSYSFFATCPKGVDALLLDELVSFGIKEVKQGAFGVWFSADMAMAYRVCLWSRLANKVILVLRSVDNSDTDAAIYQTSRDIDWQEHLDHERTFSVEFVGRSASIRHTHYGAVRVKDGLVDRFRAQGGERPNVATDTNSLRIYARLHKKTFTVGIDLSGDSLHRRGYRRGAGMAPLKENLAAALLVRAGWPGLARDGYDLLDPLCGSGTFLIEAAMMQADIAPGLTRPSFGFENWLGHIPVMWAKIRQEAQERREAGLSAQLSEIRGYDADPKVIRLAQKNIHMAGLEAVIGVGCQELVNLKRPKAERGLLLTNPPYGERLGEKESLLFLYEHLGQRLKADFAGWKAAIFTGNEDLAKAMPLYSHKQYAFHNGPIASRLLLFDLYERKNKVVEESHQQDAESADSQAALSSGASMLVNRLKKNIRQLDKWARKNHISAYRLYDADMPEYAVAVDRYGDWLQVSEYAPPKSVDPAKALKRFREVQQAVPVAFGIDENRIVYKQRRRQKGSAQYEKIDQQDNMLQLTEGDCRLLVNLQDYLDTGLFLDHRPIRLKIASMGKGKRFLNLFCYTAVASLHAAIAGATSTTSVDMSAAYLGWAKKNFALNGLSEVKHEFIQADCLKWINECGKPGGQRFDLIFLDPPSFSNSKKMQGVLDIQRDHKSLIRETMRLLAPGGLLIFSCNLKKFTFNTDLLADYQVEDVTTDTIDVDFKRSPHVHRCWFIRAG